MIKLYGCELGSYDDGWQVCWMQNLLAINLLLLGRLSAGAEV